MALSAHLNNSDVPTSPYLPRQLQSPSAIEAKGAARSATGQPKGVTAPFRPASIAAPGSGTSTITKAVASTTATGQHGTDAWVRTHSLEKGRSRPFGP